jgi:hypothetical protein
MVGGENTSTDITIGKIWKSQQRQLITEWALGKNIWK